MTQEDKELLLRDLCMRLPYKVIIHVDDHDEIFADWELDHTYTNGYRIEINYMCIEDVRPYLRPMSSMTDEEKEEFHKLKQFSVTVVMPNGVSLLKPTYIVDLEDDGDGLNHLYDWLNAHHFDYRGLIEKGLAIEAPEGMYKI